MKVTPYDLMESLLSPPHRRKVCETLQWTKLTQCAAEIRRTLPSQEGLQLPTVVGPLRRALQAPQEWPTALAALLGSQLTATDDNWAPDPAAADAPVAANAGTLPDTNGPASPPLALSPCVSVNSFRKDSFTSATGPGTPPGAPRSTSRTPAVRRKQG